MKRTVFIFLLFCFSFSVVFAQTKSIDSLKALIKSANDGISKIEMLNNLSKQYIQASNYDGAEEAAADAIVLSDKINYRKGKTDALYNIGLINNNQGNYPEALKNYLSSLKIADELGDKKILSNAYVNIGIIYREQGNYNEALKNYALALKVKEELGDKRGIGAVYNNIGIIYYEQGNNDEALKNYNAGLKIFKEIGDKKGIAFSYNGIGIIYQNQGNLDEALEAHLASLKIKTEINDKKGIAASFNNIGNIYFELDNYPEALKNHQAALKVRQELGDKKGIAASYTSIGNIYSKQNKPAEAAEYLNKGGDAPQDIAKKEEIKNKYKSLAGTDSAKGDWKAAYEHHKLYVVFKDSLANEENRKKALQLKMQYEFDKKVAMAKAEQDKKDAIADEAIQKQKWIRNTFGVAFIFILIVAFVLYNRFSNKRKANLVLEKTLIELKHTQQKLVQQEKLASLGALTAGIAHEIKNPLNFVNNFADLSKDLIEELQETKDEAEKKEIFGLIKDNLTKINFHGKRADSIVKNMLEHSRTGSNEKQLTDIDNLCDEYLNLAYHGMRANNQDFNCELKKEMTLNGTKINIVPQDISRVILNLFNNAFYAVSKKAKTEKGYAPEVKLVTLRLNDKIIIKVRDNGDGMPQSVKEKIFEPFFTTKPTGEGTGLGLSLSFDIIKAHGGDITVTSKEGEFTEFTIVLPA